MTADTDDSMEVFDAAQRDALRREWLGLIELAVWGGAQSARIGALPRMRKRVAELGERLAALDEPRSWIPRPRERLKSALATALAARDALAQCARAIEDLDVGAVRDALAAALGRIDRQAEPRIAAAAERWAQRLETLNVARIED